ncbi:MAG TPA: hypothetical protein VGG33_18465, partial [Polyangia bacterium]
MVQGYTPCVLVDLALVGFGNVARRFVRLLEERRDLLRARHDLTCRITASATRRHGAACDLDGLDALQAARIVEEGGALTGAASAASAIDALAHSRAARRV